MSAGAQPRASSIHRGGRWRIGSARYLVTHHRALLRATRNEISARYAGSALGAAWMVVTPLLMLGVYAAVYLAIFRLRIHGLGHIEYVVFIFSGLVPYLVAADAISSGVHSVISSKAVLSNAVFPIDLAPVKCVLLSLGTLMVGMAVVVIGTAATGRLGLPILLLPLVMATETMLLIGLCWILSLLNVVMRDLQNLVTLGLMMLLIGSPIAYLPSMVPSHLRLFLYLNPFSYYIIAYQKVTILSRFPSPLLVLALIAMSAATFTLGSWFFARAKHAVLDYV